MSSGAGRMNSVSEPTTCKQTWCKHYNHDLICRDNPRAHSDLRIQTWLTAKFHRMYVKLMKSRCT